MKKRNKSNLDERQEQRLLRIERNGCWLAFWGLLVAMGVQMVMSKGEDVGRVAGEWIVFMVLACYMVWACMKEGIWDRRMKPDWKTNLIASLLAGVAMAVFFYLITDWEVEQKVWTAIVSFFTDVCLLLYFAYDFCTGLQEEGGKAGVGRRRGGRKR